MGRSRPVPALPDVQLVDPLGNLTFYRRPKKQDRADVRLHFDEGGGIYSGIILNGWSGFAFLCIWGIIFHFPV